MVKKSERPFQPEEVAVYRKQFSDLLIRIRAYTEPDTGLLNAAFSIAERCHYGVRRKTGEPYICHPLSVAAILADIEVDNDVIAAGILHDVLEDTPMTFSEMEDLLGHRVASLVEAVTDIDNAIDEVSEMLKEDVDIMSDSKLITSIRRNPQALYIKVADRIHNLRTMGSMPYNKITAKVDKTRHIIIPLLQGIRCSRLIEILEDLCIGLENPPAYDLVCRRYEALLEENRISLEGVRDYMNAVFTGTGNRYALSDFELESTSSDILFTEDLKKARKMIRSCTFHRRCMHSIFHDVNRKVRNIFMDLEDAIDKDSVALYDIYFITSDSYRGEPVDIFLSFYPALQKGLYVPEAEYRQPVRFALTISGSGKDPVSDLPYFLLKDAYNCRFRLFIQNETEYRDHMHGTIFQNDSGVQGPSEADPEPDDTFRPMIHVYKKDGSIMEIDAQATVLDFAFAIHNDVGLCARHAYLNGRHAAIPLYTKLSEGDQVEIVADASKHHPEQNIPHATIRWFEYVFTRKATKVLSRYLEKHTTTVGMMMRVYDSGKKPYEIETGATILDFAFLKDPEKALHFKCAYVNKGNRPARPDRILAYDDIIRLEYDDGASPSLDWLRIVRTVRAREAVIRYFEGRIPPSSGEGLPG
jgi:GTP pyrophosphokinase